MFINLNSAERESHRGRVQRRIRQLQRKGWKWVKHGPNEPATMCAVLDSRYNGDGLLTYRPSRNALPQETISMLDQFTRNWSNGKWQCIIDYNDNPMGAKSVDDVIAVMEKFVAEL